MSFPEERPFPVQPILPPKALMLSEVGGVFPAAFARRGIVEVLEPTWKETHSAL